ncbi:Homeobox-leucine zipper protein REVOLUTA [Camellia lanceoleosa]|uniref:Homeobox-leucine zipper protein REVOLUTA n=1 Tax=Camellia lanceoleosa TaxID=1840588 RepID=A0ACC0J2U8_9ERIC|nr:Homeobox-leucine zipper protein REVOLUTA [Camellia lanceoleosa]
MEDPCIVLNMESRHQRSLPNSQCFAQAESQTIEAVIHRAMYLLRNGFGNYDVFKNNLLTIAFQFPFENNLQDNIAAMARQYVRSVISFVQRVVMATSPSGLSPTVGPKLPNWC